MEDWTGNLYCGITLEWDYIGRTVNISMPGYIKILQEYKHIMLKKLQMCVHTRLSREIWHGGPGPPPPRLDTKT
jgi:hypothetical protein